MSVAQAKITHTVDIPVQSWKRQDLIQAFTYAKDPTDGKEYIFACQADPTDVGQIEDLYIHRHVWTGAKLQYLDTMTCRSFGHQQTFHVRISAAGNPWVWSGVDQYDSKTKRSGCKVARYAYRPEVITVRSKNFAYINAGPGASLGVIASAEWKIVIRRAQSLTETYTEYNESDIIRGALVVQRKFTRAKVVGSGPFQGACAGGSGVFIVNGSTDKTQKIYQHDWKTLATGSRDISDLKAPTGPNTSDEPEGLALVRGVLHVGKRYNSTASRVYALFGLRWTSTSPNGFGVGPWGEQRCD